MEDPAPKKRKTASWAWVGLAVLVSVWGVAAIAGNTDTSAAQVAPAATVQTINAINDPVTQPTPAPEELSNDNHYTNVDGNSVHSPADSSDGCVAAGATAECGDGTCSFSQHRSGTCSHHGGVSEWL